MGSLVPESVGNSSDERASSKLHNVFCSERNPVPWFKVRAPPRPGILYAACAWHSRLSVVVFVAWASLPLRDSLFAGQVIHQQLSRECVCMYHNIQTALFAF